MSVILLGQARLSRSNKRHQVDIKLHAKSELYSSDWLVLLAMARLGIVAFFHPGRSWLHDPRAYSDYSSNCMRSRHPDLVAISLLWTVLLRYRSSTIPYQ